MPVYRKLTLEEARQKTGTNIIRFYVHFVRQDAGVPTDAIVVPYGSPEYDKWQQHYENMHFLSLTNDPLLNVTEKEREQAEEISTRCRRLPGRTLLIKELIR